MIKLLKKMFLWSSILSMSFGFRLTPYHAKWNISSSDNTLWLKPCVSDTTMKANTTLEGDQLYDQTDVTIEDALKSIISNINGIYGSYLRLELYPADPASPPSGSTFTTTKAENRTIEICTDSTPGTSAGYATPTISGGQITKCKIAYGESAHDDLKNYLALMSHEMGHCFGLDHPQEITVSVMSYFSNQDNIYRYENDDKMGLRHLFPDSLPGVDLKESPSFGLSCDTK